MKKPILLFLVLFLVATLFAQQDFKTFWVGNTWGTAPKFVQNYIVDMDMSNLNDGNASNDKVFTSCDWDEGGHQYGVYKNCDYVANSNKNPNSKSAPDKNGNTWEIINFFDDFPSPAPTGDKAP